MSPRRHIRSGLTLTAGSVTSSLCSFARNIIVARLISVDDFGIASTFAMTMSLVEITGNLALDRLIVQAADGDDPRLQNAVQGFQVLRGAIGALLLFVIAGPVAALFKIPDVAWAFRVLAAVPLIRALSHLDAARAQRGMRFGPSVLVDAGSQVLITLLAAPLAWWLDDYRVMLWLILGQAFSATAISHIVAQRRYRWAWDRSLIRRMLDFGWPLLLNGVLMFAIFQGDKAIVGAAYTMKELGWFSAAFGLTLMPAVIVPKVIATLLFPLLSRAHARGDVARQSSFTIDAFSYSAMLMAIFFCLLGPFVLVAFFGQQYAPAADIIGLLGVVQAIRVLKAGYVTVAFSAGRTRLILWSNATRAVGLVLAITSASLGFGLPAIVLSGLIGELIALLVITLCMREFGIPFRQAAGPATKAALLAAILVSGYALLDHSVQLDARVALLAKAMCCALALPMILMFKSLRSELLRDWPVLRRGCSLLRTRRSDPGLDPEGLLRQGEE